MLFASEYFDIGSTSLTTTGVGAAAGASAGGGLLASVGMTGFGRLVEQL